MSALLAVDTSGPLCSLAIQAGGRWFEDTQNVERLHNRVVLEQLDALAAAADVPRNAFTAVAFAAGPGSFTGVRIAAAVAQAVAFASGAVVVPVRSSLALATVAAHQLPVGPAPGQPEHASLLTVTRSRRDAYYLAGYRRDTSDAPVQCIDDHLHQGGEAPPLVGAEFWTGAGDRPPWWPPERPFLAIADGTIVVTARTIGEIALRVLADGSGMPAAAAVPIYVRGDSPWRPAKT